jgi:hypothetical protein
MRNDWLHSHFSMYAQSIVMVVVRFTTTFAIGAYYQYSCEFESHSWWGVLDTTLCDKVCQWLAPVSSTNITDNHDVAEILLKVVLNTITIDWAYILKWSPTCNKHFHAIGRCQSTRFTCDGAECSGSSTCNKHFHAIGRYQSTRFTCDGAECEVDRFSLVY